MKPKEIAAIDYRQMKFIPLDNRIMVLGGAYAE